MTNNQNLYIWGAGSIGVPLANYLIKRNIDVSAIIDNDSHKQKSLNLSVPVIPYNSISGESINIFISVLNKVAIEQIKEQIWKEGKSDNILSFEEL